MNRSVKKVLGVIFLIFGIQLIALYFLDPLGYPDAIRYFNFADFLYNPRVVHFGDLAYFKGLLFTPLFLPTFLVFLRKLFGFPYVLSGMIFQFISFQIILWSSYGIALLLDCKKTARLTLILLLTNLAFCRSSIFILTEYPFAATFLFALFYSLKNDTFHLRQVFVISLLFGILVSIRTQGFLFVVIIVLYLLYSKRIRLSQLGIIFSFPILYLWFHVYFYIHLNQQFPLTFALNETFTFNSFFLGRDFAQYSFFVHGLKALEAKMSVFDSIISNPYLHLSLVVQRILGFIRYVSVGLEHHFLFAGLVLFAFIYTKIKEKVFLISLILLSMVTTFLFLVEYYAFIRYQLSLFPLAIIFIASCFVRGYESKAFLIKGNSAKFILTVLLCAVFFYVAYIHHDYFLHTTVSRKDILAVICRKEAISAAKIIREEVADKQKILAAHPVQYGIIYRSGNIPLYFTNKWKQQEILDYLKSRNVHYIISKRKSIDRLQRKGVRANIIQPFYFKNAKGKDQLFLYKLLIN